MTQAEFNEKFNKVLRETVCDFGIPSLCSPWHQHARMAFRFVSPRSVGLSGSEYGELFNRFEETTELSGYDFAIINNFLEDRSAEELDLPMDQYIDVMHGAQALSTAWNNQFIPIRESILKP